MGFREKNPIISGPQTTLFALCRRHARVKFGARLARCGSRRDLGNFPSSKGRVRSVPEERHWRGRARKVEPDNNARPSRCAARLPTTPPTRSTRRARPGRARPAVRARRPRRCPSVSRPGRTTSIPRESSPTCTRGRRSRTHAGPRLDGTSTRASGSPARAARPRPSRPRPHRGGASRGASGGSRRSRTRARTSRGGSWSSPRCADAPRPRRRTTRGSRRRTTRCGESSSANTTPGRRSRRS